ncbi:hypothetical protein [Spirosoma sordidisoli]|uniref:Uncharacterized protein n=1 Tax=Spirosoma sordidisoli TaxID=2502893 RepID=A0A4Q2UND3_9BACT|nr:hypothetical protein [Spirosoma sordidisoli]RYC70836.1 hypothetical protein EQG79_01410 [Spirosoma sordidisoli]
MSQVKPDDVMKITFHVMQDGKPVAKEVKMTRQHFIDYNAKPKKKWADMYEMIVRDKAYISITDLSNSN